jgi:Fic family protein
MSYNKDIPYNNLPDLPPKSELETKEILKKIIDAVKYLSKLDGSLYQIPNPSLLLNSLVLQEAKLSSEVENIFTTNDELYKGIISDLEKNVSQSTKEVLYYKKALWKGYERLKDRGFLSINLFIELVQIIKNTDIGIRSNSGTKIVKNSNEVVYTPPEGEAVIRDKLRNLENFINDDSDGLDPLIKLAIQHYQFEAIHPFIDGNGRTGRIINILYLVNQELISLPVIYLSKYIIENKADYYQRLTDVTEKQNWQAWIEYMIEAVKQTAINTLNTLEEIISAMSNDTEEIKAKLPKIYSKDLVELIYSQPYCKIKFLEERNIVKKETASKYLSQLEEIGILESFKLGKEIIYINKKLLDIINRSS